MGLFVVLDDLHVSRVVVAANADLAAILRDLTRWPFQRARIQLAYGRWLRRQRRVADSRAVLRSARDTFDALGCTPWGEQARRELRASGERSRQRVPEARDQLTAQELQIAQLAARGMTNREIGAAAVPLAPHDQHAPVPRVPEAGDHVAGRVERRATYVSA